MLPKGLWCRIVFATGIPGTAAALLSFMGVTDTWYLTVLLIQAVLGALTASLTLLIVRRWLPGRWAAGAGAAVALWPHNVVISGFVLSETYSGFMVVVAVWLSCRAFESTSRARWLTSGLAFGGAAMVNATITPFASMLAMLWKRRMLAPSLALVLLLWDRWRCRRRERSVVCLLAAIDRLPDVLW